MGIKSIYGQIFGIIKRFYGAYPGFGAGEQELLLADKRQKKAVFFIQSQVLELFCLQSKRPSSVTCSICHSFRQWCAVIFISIYLGIKNPVSHRNRVFDKALLGIDVDRLRLDRFRLGQADDQNAVFEIRLGFVGLYIGREHDRTLK